MANEVICPGGHKLQVRPEHAGKEVRCPICKATMVVPDLWGGSSEVPLRPADPPVESPRFVQAPMSKGSSSMTNSGGALKVVAYLAMAIGVVMVVSARGCDSLFNRNQASVSAKLMSEKEQFKRETEDKVDDAKDADKDKVRKDRDEARVKLEKGAWKALERNVEDAHLAEAKWGWWFELGFVVGSIVLVLGLLGMGVLGQGAERMISLIMVAIITFSIYVGGVAWLASIKNAVTGGGGILHP